MESKTKILAWNLHFFDLDRIATVADPADHRLPMAERVTALNKLYNDIYLWWTITDLDPDIFVMTELKTDGGELGTLITGKGALAALKVLTDLRKHNPNWCLVPPVRINHVLQKRQGKHRSTYTEGIGVFYRSDRLDFTGPWFWPGATNPDDSKKGPVAIPANAGQQYPDIWADCLPPACNFAGRVILKDSNGRLVDFVDRAHRRPFFTTFRERHDGRRNIHLASVHLLPLTNANPVDTIKRALNKVVLWFPAYQPVINNTVSIIAGDLNLDRNREDVEDDLYEKTNTMEGDWVFPSGYISSYKAIDNATAASYIGRSLNDNALVRYTQDLVAQPKTGLIGDIAAGINSYVNVDALQPQPPTAPATMVMRLDGPPAPQSSDIDPNAVFRSPQNFGHVSKDSGISDHMPIYFEV